MNENGQLLVGTDGEDTNLCGWMESTGWKIDIMDTWMSSSQLESIIQEWGQEVVTMDPGLAGVMTLPAKDGKSARQYQCTSTGEINPNLETYA